MNLFREIGIGPLSRSNKVAAQDRPIRCLQASPKTEEEKREVKMVVVEADFIAGYRWIK